MNDIKKDFDHKVSKFMRLLYKIKEVEKKEPDYKKILQLKVSSDVRSEIFKESYVLENKASLLFQYLREISDRDNFYFIGCSFDVYKNTYNQRLQEDSDYATDITEKHFINEEMSIVEHLIPKVLEMDMSFEEVLYSSDRIKDFLKDKKMIFKENYQNKPKNYKEITVFDLVYLFEQIGFLSHLKKNKELSNKAIATFMNKITGKSIEVYRKELSNISNDNHLATKEEKMKEITAFIAKMKTL
jgi:hypothetical protein